MPCLHAQLDLTQFLYSQATPYTLAFWRQRLGTITTSSKLIAQHVQLACLPAPNMRAKQPGLTIICRRYRLLPGCGKTEEIINLTHGGLIGWLWCHMPSGYAWPWVANLITTRFYDPVVLASQNSYASVVIFRCFSDSEKSDRVEVILVGWFSIAHPSSWHERASLSSFGTSWSIDGTPAI